MGRCTITPGIFPPSLKNTFDDLCELEQPNFTYRAMEHGRIKRLAKIDRIFVNTPMAILQDYKPHKGDPISDH